MADEEVTKAERVVTDGALALRAYLEAHCLSISVFCEQNGLDRVQVQRVLNGERGKRITVAFADAIARATDDEVPLSAWRPKPPEAATSTRDVSADATGPQKTAAANDADATKAAG